MAAKGILLGKGLWLLAGAAVGVGAWAASQPGQRVSPPPPGSGGGTWTPPKAGPPLLGGGASLPGTTAFLPDVAKIAQNAINAGYGFGVDLGVDYAHLAGLIQSTVVGWQAAASSDLTSLWDGLDGAWQSLWASLQPGTSCLPGWVPTGHGDCAPAPPRHAISAKATPLSIAGVRDRYAWVADYPNTQSYDASHDGPPVGITGPGIAQGTIPWSEAFVIVDATNQGPPNINGGSTTYFRGYGYLDPAKNLGWLSAFDVAQPGFTLTSYRGRPNPF